MTEYSHVLEDIPAHDMPVGKIRMLAGKQGSIFWITTDPGTEAPLHSHPMEQTTWLVSGTMDAQVDGGERHRVAPGSALLIPAGVPHQFWYLDTCTIVEFATPPRTDWFPGAKTHPYGLEQDEAAAAG
ncbi:MAG: cupin domain-containing protein [Sphingomonas sp.]